MRRRDSGRLSNPPPYLLPMRTLLISLTLLLAACTTTSGPGEPRVLFVGDSVMAWNRAQGASISHAVSARTGLATRNVAVPGAGLLSGSIFGRAIPDQIRPGPWDWIIANGGANDLNDLCNCARCDAEIDRLISRDGRVGEWPTLVARMKSAGAAQVMILGYYGPVNGGGGGFDRCNDEVAELDRRFARLAARDRRVTHVTARDVFDGSRSLYAADLIHPSRQGSARIGALVARAMAR